MEDNLNNFEYGGDEWVDIRQILRQIQNYFTDGYFYANKNDYNSKINNFLKGISYKGGEFGSYIKGEYIKDLPPDTTGIWDSNSKIPVYRAIGNDTLFRGISVDDWDRIRRTGFIDSDMRGAIANTEGINLAQTPSTAHYYLPHNNKGVILAISPKNLDLYMLYDEYIRVFEPIPLKNVIKISDVFLKNSLGADLCVDTEKKYNELLDRLKSLNIEFTC